MWQRGLGLGLCTPRCVNWVVVAPPGPPPAFVVRLPPAGAKGIVCPKEEKSGAPGILLQPREENTSGVGRPKVWVSRLVLPPFVTTTLKR